jgi:tRNA-splicing ligase RtcB
MLQRVLKDVLMHVMGNSAFEDLYRLSPQFFRVDCHHNYTSIENHFGKNIYVTRKGAVSAKEGEWGIIPGSMGARSFIVQGLGNPQSFNSCSHGAGRKMSRTKAREMFTIKDLAAQTQGIECRKDDGVVDEIPSAYKDIDQVMSDQADLVRPVYELKQILCIKGD